MELAITLKGVEKLPDYLEQEIRKRLVSLKSILIICNRGMSLSIKLEVFTKWK